jgi:hypothetical protein
MPHILRFHDTDDGTQLPDPAAVGHAAAWAAERGYWDVATTLMELAHALAELESPTPAGRYPESALTDALATPAPRCSHGYAIGSHGQHIATGGTCTDAPNGVPDPPLCHEHGQTMLRGAPNEIGLSEWLCICTVRE